MKKKLQRLVLQTHVKIYSLLEIIGAIIFVIGCYVSEFGNIHPVVWLGGAMIVLGICWCFLFMKCPHCGTRFYYMRHIPNYCPDCGKELF